MTPLIPHPVLVSNGKDYKDGSSFDMKVNDTKITLDNNIDVSGRFDLKSRFLKRLITKKLAAVFVVAKCARTYKRNVYQADGDKFEFTLPLADYADKIVMLPFIASTNEIGSFASKEHDDEFRGIPISIPAGAILAIGAGHEFTVDSLRMLGAAIRLVTNDGLEDGRFVLDIEDDFINIQVNVETRRKVLAKRTDNKHLFPALYMPALTHAIMNINENKSRKWAEVLAKTLETNKIGKTEQDETPYLCAQKLLENPLNFILEEENGHD